MKLSEQWLREWVSPKLDTQELAHTLTMAGLEVGGIEPVAPALKKIVVGEIIKAEPHPNADRLQVCQVDVGKAKPLQIVCGASNAAAGRKAPVALVGATLPNGTVIKQAKLRDVDSFGMLCSAAELGLEEKSDGLLLLDAKAKVGVAISEALALDDCSLDIDLTPNRGDCLSVQGVARELAAITSSRFKTLRIPTVRARSRRSVAVSLNAKQDCPHYIGRVIEDIDPKAITPLWMQERLRRGGIRNLGPVIDVTNYVLLELGQPMHAFDLEKLQGGIRVQRAKGGESLTLLDGNNIKLEAGSLLICDSKRPLALAGIMGGQDSAVSDNTHHIMLESAYFAPDAIAGRARSLGLHTESSHRFERGVDPALQRLAIERATALLVDIVGGSPGPVVERKHAPALPKRKAIVLRQAYLHRLLGLHLAPKRVETLLKRLGMKVTANPKGWRVTPPSYRFDITSEVDLIEEVARIHGYDNIPEQQPSLSISPMAVPETQASDARLRDLLVARDYQEVITYSFVDPSWQQQLHPGQAMARLANPISADMAVMRTSLWTGLLQAIVYNQNRQQTRIRLFELGRRFLPQGKAMQQDLMLAGALYGSQLPEQWGSKPQEVDFFDAKADLVAILELAGLAQGVRFIPQEHTGLHPGQAAVVLHNKQEIGIIGALHPALQAKFGLERPVMLFELALSALQQGEVPKFEEISRFPAIRRDLAVVLDETIAAQAVQDVISKVAGNLLVNLELFDEYRGEGIDSGRKSLALGLTLQDSSRTLKESEVETVKQRVLAALQSELGAQLRE